MSETKELRKPVSLQNLSSPSSRSSNNGTRIGPYLVGKTLGVGSTGRVKLGTHIENPFLDASFSDTLERIITERRSILSLNE